MMKRLSKPMRPLRARLSRRLLSERLLQQVLNAEPRLTGTAVAEHPRAIAVTSVGNIKITGRLVDGNLDFDPDPVDEYFVAMQYPTPANLTRYQSYLLSLNQTP